MCARRQSHGFILLLVVAASGCGGSKSPTAPTVTATSVTVAVAGNASTTLTPGETRQLSALALQSNGTTVDVTTIAAWQSSAAAIATISPAGLLTAVGEGSVDVTARYVTASGTLRAEVRPTCTVSITPASAAYGAFGGTSTVTVSVNSASCRWSARSDASWFPFVFDAANPGSGSFVYAVPANSTPFARTATVTVETSTGQRAAHAIAEDKPLGCSYVTQPEEITFSASGGSGQFTVVTTPGNCQWNMVNGMAALGVSITSGFGGTGTTLVRYIVQAHTRPVDADGYLEIAGLSGLNPNGRHHIIIQNR
jgi:hypothetical protein